MSSARASHFPVQRFRIRLAVRRLSMGRPSALDTINLLLAVIGAWAVLYQILKFVVPGDDSAVGLPVAGSIAVVASMALTWVRLARRPQDLFKASARSEDKAETLRRMMAEGMTQGFAYQNLVRL